MTINADVYIRRNKLRRIFETEFNKINSEIKAACKEANVTAFHIRYSSHLLDRAIQREIDESYVFRLFHKLHTQVKEVVEFLQLTPLPDVEDEIKADVEYRPLRLEITDRNLWLGMTVDKNRNGSAYADGLMCRMAFVNNKRLEGKISTKVIDL